MFLILIWLILWGIFQYFGYVTTEQTSIEYDCLNLTDLKNTLHVISFSNPVTDEHIYTHVYTHLHTQTIKISMSNKHENIKYRIIIIISFIITT